MKPLQTKTNVDPPNGDYPFGKIRDNPGDNTGTPVNVLLYADMHQFFEKLFNVSGLVANNLPDNAYSGFQLMDALRKVCGQVIVVEQAWNMDTTKSITVNIPTDLTGATVLGVSVMVHSSINNLGRPLVSYDGTIDDGSMSGGISNNGTLGSPSFTLTRTDSGAFDNAVFNASTARVTVWYIPPVGS